MEREIANKKGLLLERPYRLASSPLPPLWRGKLICRNAKPPPYGTGEGNREAVEGAL